VLSDVSTNLTNDGDPEPAVRCGCVALAIGVVECGPLDDPYPPREVESQARDRPVKATDLVSVVACGQPLALKERTAADGPTP
jgi:hypothetical protein